MVDALAYCRGAEWGERTSISIAVLQLLKSNPKARAADLAGQAKCQRRHLFNVLKWVRLKKYDQLVGRTFACACLLNEQRQSELKQKLGKEYFRAKEVTAWYQDWSGKPMTEWAAYKWCKRLGKPLGKLRGPIRPSGVRKRKKTFSLNRAQLTELRRRQISERRIDGIEKGSLASRWQENPTLRIEAVIRYGTTKESLRQISTILKTDAGRWYRLYADGGDIDTLCFAGTKRARSRRNLGPIESEA